MSSSHVDPKTSPHKLSHINEPPANKLLCAQKVCKTFPAPAGKSVRVLQDISCALYRNQTLGVIGESGCGKSTLAKLFMRIEEPTSGKLYFADALYKTIPLAKFRPKIQMIFQDSYSSLNPRKKIIHSVAEPLYVNSDLSKDECLQKAQQILEQVGLTSEYWYRYPHMFSGGQRQRIGIARAVIIKPEIVVCDEPVSALDISVQAQIINLLLEVKRKYHLSYFFISHDLAVVSHFSDFIMVMYMGKIMEYGRVDAVFSSPKHPYTHLMLDSLTHNKRSRMIPAFHLPEIPSPYDPPKGCVFHTRCPIAKSECRHETPHLREVAGRKVACHLV